MTRFTLEEKELGCQKLAWSKRTWLEQFSYGRNARPDFEVSQKRAELELLEEIASDYRRAAAQRQENAA